MPATAVPFAVATFTVTDSPAPGATLRLTANDAVVVAEVERMTPASLTETVNWPWRLIRVAVPTGSAIVAAVGDDSTRLRLSVTPRRAVGEMGTDTVWDALPPLPKFNVPDWAV